MRLSLRTAVSSFLACFFAGCGDQVQTGCPPIVGSTGVIMVYKRQQEEAYAVFIRCNGQDQFQLLPNYGYPSCPSPVDQATLVTVIDATCAGSVSTTQTPDFPSSWTYSSMSSSQVSSTQTSETTTMSSSESSESTTTTTTTTSETTTTEESTTTTTESPTTESVTSEITA